MAVSIYYTFKLSIADLSLKAWRGKTAKDIAVETNQTEWLKWCENAMGAQLRKGAPKKESRLAHENRVIDLGSSLPTSFSKISYTPHLESTEEQSNQVQIEYTYINIKAMDK
jgi:hypothetical protein